MLTGHASGLRRPEDAQSHGHRPGCGGSAARKPTAAGGARS